MRNKKVFNLVGDLTTALRFAVLGDSERFVKHKHAWKAWKTLKEFGCTVYPVAENIRQMEGVRVYSDLADLEGKIDVVVPCLRADLIPDIVERAQISGIGTIWFQEGNWTQEFQDKANAAGIKVVRGCLLKHKVFTKPVAYLNPCFWHGLRSAKVDKKQNH